MRTAPPRLRLALVTLLALLVPGAALAQDAPDEPPDEPAPPTIQPTVPGQGPPAEFGGALQTLRAPASATGPGAAARAPEIFPDAGRVWMNVRDTDPLPIETARRGGPWLCASGQCAVTNGDPGRSKVGDDMLRSVKLQTPTLPLPLTLWGRVGGHGSRVLDFDPVLLGRRSYAHVCAYRPTEPVTSDPRTPRKQDKVLICRDGPPEPPAPDSGEITLGLQWPRQSELADFRYLAIVDSCGNARVQPFQRTFTVPAYEVASGGCGQADGKVLRVFPQGGWLRVTAFNLDAPASGNVMNATYRVTLPPLENLVESSPARLLFPDPLLADLQVDCGPSLRKATPDAQGIPPVRPGPQMVEPETVIPPKDEDRPGPGKPDGDKPAPGSKPPGDAAAADKAPARAAPPPPPAGPRAPSGPPARREVVQVGPGPQPLAHQAIVIAPEPLRQGNCKVRLLGQTKRRLVAPLALHVSLTRTDRSKNGAPEELLTDGHWIVTPSNAEFSIPPLAEGFDGDSRLRLTVSSDPLSNNGKVVLLADAGRVSTSLRSTDRGEADRARRLIGSVTIHSVPLCGQQNFETLEGSGSCLRAYITIPAILGMIQLTRAPWVEKPLITRNVFSAVGAALAVDSYNPVERKAFPIAAQVGGLFENLGDGKLGLLGYIGIAPTIPVLGAGGNTTSIGFLGGVGVVYVINEKGPDEGAKPAAFLSVLVSVGQANPWVKSGGP
jgi:hypothetical protein